VTTTQILRQLLPFAWHRRGSMCLVAVFMIANVGVVALAPWPLKVIVDNALGGKPLEGTLGAIFEALPGDPTREALLWWATAATVLIFVLRWALNLATQWAGVRFGQRLSYDVAGALFAHLQRLSLRYHSRHGVGSSIRRITTDSECVATIIQSALLPLATAVVTIATMLSIMWQLDPTLTLVSLGVIPLMVFTIRHFAGPMADRSYDQQVAEGEMYETLEQTLTGLPVVQAFQREELGDARFALNTEQIMRATIAMTWAQFHFKILIGTATAVGTAAVFWLGAEHGLSGELTVGTLLVFLAYLGSFYGPLEEVSYSSTTITEAAGSARRVLEALNAEPEVREAPDAVAVAGVRGEVAYDGVSFGYDDSRWVLSDVSFTADPGQVVAIVGATGAGKSTLVSLLPRFFDPDAGRVSIDGHDLRDLTLNTVRSNVSLVLQESFLFPFSLAENIAYGRPGASQDEIEAAARAANAHDFISRLPDGYDTVVGERGATLSGGERQRVAIARALLKDAPILILDEPTSALDAHTEHLLLEALERLMAGRTTLIIAHRLSTIRAADQILVLDNGRIIERGTHHQLVAEHGSYARMHGIQHGAPQADAPVAEPAPWAARPRRVPRPWLQRLMKAAGMREAAR
jgi:ATP-binding cassette, subfamily B, bacterial